MMNVVMVKLSFPEKPCINKIFAATPTRQPFRAYPFAASFFIGLLYGSPSDAMGGLFAPGIV